MAWARLGLDARSISSSAPACLTVAGLALEVTSGCALDNPLARGTPA
jgi:hypothetical protein